MCRLEGGLKLGRDGKIQVYNECRQGSLEGAVKSMRGKAKVVDPATNAKLKVTFFWPFYGDYRMIDPGENYEYGVVGHSKRKYGQMAANRHIVWEMSYTQTMQVFPSYPPKKEPVKMTGPLF